MSKVKTGSLVKVHYTGKLRSGEVFDSSEGREPLGFEVGAGQMIPGFEKGVMDMELNERKTIEIPAHEAYGEEREELFQKVDRSQLPQDIAPEVGMGLTAQMEDGRQQQFVISEVEEKTVTLNANHPLAGKELIFEVEVVEIQ